MIEQELCIYCNKPMVIATESRGYRTLRCSRGCQCYRSIEIAVLKPETASSADVAKNLMNSQPVVVTV